MEHCFGPLRTEKNRADLTACTENIMLARVTHFPAPIAELCDPEKMPEYLRAAHEHKDEMLERNCMGRRFRKDSEWLEKLFDLCTGVTGSEEVSLKKRLQATRARGR